MHPSNSIGSDTAGIALSVVNIGSSCFIYLTTTSGRPEPEYALCRVMTLVVQAGVQNHCIFLIAVNPQTTKTNT